MNGEPKEPRYEEYRKRAEKILISVKERISELPLMRDSLFARHRQEPRPETFRTITNEIIICFDRIDRVQRTLMEAYSNARKAKDTRAMKCCKSLLSDSNKALTHLVKIWDTTFRQAAAEGMLLPQEELVVARQGLDNVVRSTQMLQRYIRVLMDTKADAETGEIPVADEDRLSGFFEQLREMSENAMDRADLARRGDPRNGPLVSESTLLIKDLNHVVEKLAQVREAAIEAGLLSDPDYFEEDDEDR